MKSWDEQPFSEIEGQPKLTRADVVYTYHGDLEREGHIAYVMCYSSNTIAYFTGYEQVTGRLGEHTLALLFSTTTALSSKELSQTP